MSPEELYKDEANIAKASDGRWYYTPDKFAAKLAFLIGSLAITALGVILIWDPAVRYLFGEQEMARITRIERNDPDTEPQLIRYRKEIPEGDYFTRFTYTATVDQEDGSSRDFTLAIGSRRNAFVNVNDDVEIIYFTEDSHAYQLYEHRTWSFGIGFLFVGGLLTSCAVPTLLAVGKPILIDEEAAEDLSEDPAHA
ncbi:hypothetical protein [Pelagicoccus sp. SDUM812005]|uniref:hypothetical protein n=1 Tax=Pelagicoccus sp. SDUM812005 TaxID=3041257 RepID=UPI00280CAC39|nr:hypothetical protein [Pelagicoccus sp. SDUM812005]MDQ8181419.1 hypothetical protein [Pelagicoccus sp. SDUM812005]